MRLLRAELTRLFVRRFTLIGLVGLVALLSVIAIGVAATNHRPTPAEEVSARIQADQARTEMLATYQQCLDTQAGTPTGPDATKFPPGFDCQQITAHPPRVADFMPPSFVLANGGPDLFRALGAILALFGFAVGASFIGAEWSSGGVMNLLLWRPSRIRVWLGKLTALLSGVLCVGVLLSLLWYAVLWVIAGQRGSSSMNAGQLGSLALVDVRALALALAAAALGYAISTLGRNTATALGVAVTWVVVFEFGLRIVLVLLGVARPERWLLSMYVSAWLTETEHFYDDSSCRGGNQCVPHEWTMTWHQSAIVGAVLLGVVVTASLYAFRRRDVT
jgi:ABC-2 type transport system permease protein